jgi:2-methylcitrate dehydratase PrpD
VGRTTPESFVTDLRLDDCPPEVVRRAEQCVLDLVAVAAAGSRTRCSRLMRDHAVGHLASGEVRAHGGPTRLLFDGRRASPAGAALATGTTIDSLDGHDGHPLTKGHAGAAVFAAVLACADVQDPPSGAEVLAGLVVGYEVATRAGMALHTTASDHHCSGAWNSLGAAAAAARLLRLDNNAVRQALGIAEYHGPRGPLLRCLAHPTMVKDGSGWGAMTGMSATYLAAAGFTGAPAETVEGLQAETLWGDLGQRWRLLEHYVKPYPVCRWAHPAVDAALVLRREALVTPAEVARVEITTFDPAVRLAERRPATTEAAQYSLPFAVAAAIVHGELGPREVDAPALADPEVRRIGTTTTLLANESYTARFPEERWGEVTIVRDDGSRLASGPRMRDREPEPLSPDALVEKYRSYTEPVLGSDRSARIAALVAELPDTASVGDLLRELLEATPNAPAEG